MREQLNLLFELQKIDSGIELRKRNIAQLDDGTQARAAHEKALAQLQETQAQLTANEAALKDKELRLNGTEQDREQRRQRAKAAASNPKEVAALDKKIDELTRLAGKLEEDILLLMDEVEAGRAQATEQQAAVDKLAAVVADKEETYTTARKRMKKEIIQLTAQREELTPKIDAALLTQYDNIRARAAGLAIVEVKNGTCGGCQTAVPTSSVANAREARTIVKCESCRRILFVP